MPAPKIDDYRFGRVVIDGHRYTKDVIVFPDRVHPNWWRVEGHALAVEDLEEVFASPPQVLIIGSGAYRRMDVPDGTRRRLEEAGMRVIIADTGRACETYNRMRAEGGVVAALHLTC